MACTVSAPTVHTQCTYAAHTLHIHAACIEFIRWQHSASTLISECFSTSGRASWIFCITLGGRPICGVERRTGGTANNATDRAHSPCCAEQPGAKLHGLRRLGWCGKTKAGNML